MFVFLFVMVVLATVFGLAHIALDIKEDYTPAQDWFWAFQVKEQYYLPSHMEGWPDSEELAEMMVIVSEEGKIWSGTTLDLRDWEALEFELDLGWAPAEVTWVHEADADPSDDGVVLYTNNRTYVPRPKAQEAVVIWEETPIPLPVSNLPNDLTPQPMDEIYLAVLHGEVANLPWEKKNNKTVAY